MDKHEVASILEEIETLLAIQGENPFKVRAYHNAARAIENLNEDLETVVRRHALEELPGIGVKIAEKITILVEKGRLPYYEKLKKSIPKGLLALLQVPGLGPKKAKVLYQKLKVKSVEDLAEKCRRGKLARLRGFGVKTQENLLKNIARLSSYSRRILWFKGAEIGQPILKKLSQLKGVQQAEIAGSYRRQLETVGDLDFLIASSSPKQVSDWFCKQSWVEQVISKGPTKSSVRLQEGLQADLRVVSESEFGFALLYFTGSKEHNIKLRQRALKQGFSLSEYGLAPLKSRRPASFKKKNPTEEDIYKFLKLPYIPPELRENLGEIEAAEKGKLPHLIEEKDIRGVFHCHTTDSDGHNTLEEMVKAAQELDFEYLGISDHSRSSVQANGMNEERLFKQIARIRALNRSKKFSTHIFSGLECDILGDGKLDFSNQVLKELDYVIVSVHRLYASNEKTMTARLIKAIENPYATMLGHLTGRLLLRREAYAVNVPKVIDACIANHKIIELNAHPMRLDMDWRHWRKAAEKGLKCSINPDAHRAQDLEYYQLGVHIARKGWLEKKDVLNTLSLSKVQTYLKR